MVYGLILTVALSVLFYTNISKMEAVDFEAETEKVISIITHRISQYESGLIQTRAFMETTERVSAEKFKDYFDRTDLMNRFPGLQGLGFAAHLKRGDQLPPKLWPAGEREIYTPIIFLEPQTLKNEKAMGFDMYTEKNRREAMDLSYKLNLPVATKKIILVQENSKQSSPGFNIYLPVFQKASNELIGFLYSPFRFKILMEALEPSLNSHLAFSIYDRESFEEKDCFYSTTTDEDFGKYKAKKALPIGGRKYVVHFRSLESFHSANYFPVYVTVFIGVLSSLFFGIIMYFQNRQSSLIESKELQTKELKILSDAIENSLNGFDIVNSSGTFQYVNKAYLEMWGYDSASEVLGTSPALHCADPDVPFKIINALKTDKKCDIEFKAKRKDGSLFDVRMLAFLTHDVDGKEIYPTTSVDISNQRAIEERLKDAVKARDEFLSIASHELKTPLTSLLLQAQMNARTIKPDDAKGLKFSEGILKHIARISTLVDDMLDVARLRTGKFTLTKEATDLKEMTIDTVKRLESQIEAAGVKLPDIKANGDLNGVWDRVRLGQVLSNLITNALKYGDNKPFEIELKDHGTTVEIIVRDQGIGIPAEFKDKLFNRFERALNSHEASGLGLGLFIVKQIVEAHSGTITFEAAPGKGTAFHIILPKAETR